MNYSYKIFASALVCLLACPCAAQVQVENPWIQLAPPAAAVNAAYMKIHNPQIRPQTIVGLSADCCAMVMLHQTSVQGDKVSMEHLDQLIIPAQTSVELAPGGLHIMLMQAEAELSIDREVKITFSFSDGTTQDVNLGVKKDEP